MILRNIAFVVAILSGLSLNVIAQNTNTMIPQADPNDYYYQIPDYPANYSAENVAARMIDGLGFRFYWATQGLRQTDLDYKPGEDARTTAETIDHVYGLSLTIINATESKINEPSDRTGLTDADKRRLALEKMKAASEVLKDAKPGQINEMRSIFKRGEDDTFELPFWNMINGPIADAIYHTGQIISFRRSSGNPANPNVSLFQGRVRE